MGVRQAVDSNTREWGEVAVALFSVLSLLILEW